VTINRLNGFAGAVALSISGLPGTFSARFSANPASTSSILTITAPRARFSTIRFTVTGTSGALVHSVNGSLTVF
jgi:hypothetical protein